MEPRDLACGTLSVQLRNSEHHLRTGPLTAEGAAFSGSMNAALCGQTHATMYFLDGMHTDSAYNNYDDDNDELKFLGTQGNGVPAPLIIGQ